MESASCSEISVGKKKFSRIHYEQFDAPAKNVGASFFCQFKRYDVIVPDEEQYRDFDIMLYDKENDCYIPVEVEVKNVWTKYGEWQG
jgi:hypothetical protein